MAEFKQPLWCHDDAHNWGQSLQEVASSRGYDARLFSQPMRAITEGTVFLHMHSHPAVRLHHKRMAQQFATNPDIVLIPSYKIASLYDDRLEQLRHLAAFMPPTRIFTSPQQARDFVETQPPLPIVSKSGEGSGIRLLRTYDDLHREVKLAFSDLGLKNRFGVRHHGYVYWQKFMGEHDYSMRILGIGSQRMAIKRGNRGQGAERTAIPATFTEAESALQFANELIAQQGFNFGAYDLIPDGAGGWKLLKLSVGWYVLRYAGATFIPDGRKGASVWEVLMDEIEAGNM